MSRNPEESVSTTKRVKLQGQDAGSIEDGESTESENAGTDGDGQTVEGESAGVDAGGQRLEGDNAEIDGKSQRVEGENADIYGGGQRAESENADIDGSGPRVEGENAEIGGGGQSVEGENAGIDGGGQRAESENADIAGGQRMEGENADIDGSGQRVEDENAEIGGGGQSVEGENAGIDGGGQRMEGENADIGGDGESVEGENAGIDVGGQRAESENADIAGGQRVEGENAETDADGQRVEEVNAGIDGNSQRMEGENADIDGDGQKMEGEHAGIGGGGQSVEGENAGIDVSGQRVESENADIAGGQRVDGENAGTDADGQKVEVNAGIDGNRQRMEGENADIDGDGQKMEGEHAGIDASGLRTEGEHARIGGSSQRVEGEKAGIVAGGQSEEGDDAGIDEGGEQVENDDAGKNENDQEMEDVGKNEGEDLLDLEGERSQGEEQVTGNDSETEAKVKIIDSSLVVDEEMIKIENIDIPLDRSESICVDVLNDEKQIKTAVLTRIRRRLLRSFRKLKERLQQPQINRLTLYIFGSEDAVLKECERAKNVDTFVIHPYSTLRSYYIMYVLALTFANLIITPLGITFFDKDQGLKTIAWRMFSFASDILYLVDIIINFRVGFFCEDREVVNLNPKEIAMRYVKTWLVIDLAAAFPLDSILFLITISGIYTFTSYTFSKFLRFLYFGRIVSLVQLLQVSSLMRRFKEWELATDVNLEPIQLILRTFSVCFLILIICHWNGCIQFFIPMIQGFPEDSWVAKANLTKAWWADQYSAGVFRAISHTLGNSYGTGGLPTELTEVAVTVVSMISGALMHTIMVANVADMVLNADVPGRMYREKLCQVEEYTKNKRLPRHLRMKISNYYRERFHGKWFNQEAIISEMTEYLKEDVLTYLCRSLVQNVPMFQNADPNFLKAIIVNLRYEVFQKDDVIIREGDVADRMFFIDSGIVSVETEYYQKHLSDGAYFGEICLLTKGYRKASVRALTLCKLYSLSADKFSNLLKQFPAAREEILLVVAKRQHALKKAIDRWKPS